MFSGVGEFFRPLTAPVRETDPAAQLPAVRKAGDDTKENFSDTLDSDDSARHTAPEDPTYAGEFGEDITVLSLAAMRALLTGDAGVLPPVSGLAADIPDTDMPLRMATDIYRHADALAPASPRPAASYRQPQAAPETGERILAMLAALEQRGIDSVSVQPGQSIYEALLALRAPPPDADKNEL